MEQVIYWSSFTFNEWRFYVAATKEGLFYVGSPNSPFSDLEKMVEKYFISFKIINDDFKLEPYIRELKEYFVSERKYLMLPLDVKGTPFQQKVWQALTEIPFGMTCSYSEIAEKIGKPTAVRAVGGAIGANPVLITIPCHRVIGKNGSLTGFRAGIELKKYLLSLEQRG